MKLKTLALVALGATGLFAQESDKPLSLGLKVGIPLTDMYSASNTTLFDGSQPNSIYSSHAPRYLFGASAEFKMPKHLRLEIDGLFKRSGFVSSSPYNGLADLGYYRDSMNVWEFPALLKTNITLGHVRPFIDFGAALRHISSVKTDAALPGVVGNIITDNAMEIHNRNTFGAVAGIGITFKKGPFSLSPEVRYTRWGNESFRADGLRTNLDQGDVMLGINF